MATDSAVIAPKDGLSTSKKLLSLLRQKKAALGIQDLYYFAKYILCYERIEEQPHRELCDFLQHPHHRKLILEPRNSFKSTIATISYSVWRILQNPDIRILIDSQDLANSKKFLSEIKGHFETNQIFRSLYGDLVGNKWTESEIIVKNRTKVRKEPTILTAGVETPRVGMHFDLIISDDLHSEHNVSTPEQVTKVIDHWKLNSAILETEGDEIIIGTRWLVGDLYETIINKEKERRKLERKKQYIIRRRSAIYEDGNLHFPTRLTKEYLDDQKLLLGSKFYACQYLNNPVDDDATAFKRKWIQFYGRYAPEQLNITVTLDPAISEKDEACDTSFIIMGTDVDGYMYILDAYFLKADPKVIIDSMFEIKKRWPKLRTMGIEVVAFQKALKYWAWERMRQVGNFINIVELKTDTRVTKDMRIKALIPYVESGTLRFPGMGPESLSPNLRKLYDQMVEYPMAVMKDGLDALAYQLQLYTPPMVRKTPEPVVYSFQELMKQERAKRVISGLGKLPVIGRQALMKGTVTSLERIHV